MLMAIERETTLFVETNFEARVEAIDRLEYQVMDRIEELLFSGGDRSLLLSLRARAEALRARLEAVDLCLFDRMRAEIRAGTCLRDIASACCDIGVAGEIGYDTLDIFVNRLLAFDSLPKQTVMLGPEMVYFQKTPARIVFELVATVGFTPEDVFFDLGSGLGQVVMLVRLLAGVRAVGIEVEPAFAAYARERAGELGLSSLSFIATDARYADYSSGTVFFLYTPFVGGLLLEVLGLLRREAFNRRIRVVAYGPCVADMVLQDWLEPVDGSADADAYRLKVFRSL